MYKTIPCPKGMEIVSPLVKPTQVVSPVTLIKLGCVTLSGPCHVLSFENMLFLIVLAWLCKGEIPFCLCNLSALFVKRITFWIKIYLITKRFPNLLLLRKDFWFGSFFVFPLIIIFPEKFESSPEGQRPLFKVECCKTFNFCLRPPGPEHSFE